MDKIKNISIREFLRRQGMQARKEYNGYGMYVSPFRAESKASLKVDYRKNLWYDHGSGQGGSIIDLAMKL